MHNNSCNENPPKVPQGITLCLGIRVFKKICTGFTHHKGKLAVVFVFLFIYIITTSHTNIHKTDHTGPTIKGNIEAFINQKRNCQYCELTEGRDVMVILILDEWISVKEIEVILDTWGSRVSRGDILFILSAREQIETEIMEKYHVIEERDPVSFYSLLFQYIEDLKIWDQYPWFFLLRSTSVYVRFDKLVAAIQRMDPNQIIMLGISSSPNQSLCGLEHGVIISDYFVRVISACMREFNTLKECLLVLGIYCDSETLKSVFSTEISHMNNLLWRNPLHTNAIMDEMILLNTPSPNDIFYLIDTANYQEEYFQLKNEIEKLEKTEEKCPQMMNREMEQNEKVKNSEYKDSNLYRDIWLYINDGMLASSNSEKPQDVDKEYQKELHKLAENIYTEHKYGIGYENFTKFYLKEIVIHHSFESRNYFITSFVEDKFPNYIFVQIWKEQLRSAKGMIRSITPVNSTGKVVKIAIVLITTQNTSLHSINKFSKYLNRMNDKFKFEYFVVKIAESDSQNSENNILIHLMKENLREYQILLCTDPEILIEEEEFDLSSVMTVEGHQAYMQSNGLISIHSKDIFKIDAGLWINCTVIEMIECIKVAIEQHTRMVVLKLY